MSSTWQWWKPPSSLVKTLKVFSFDPNSGSSTLIQSVRQSTEGGSIIDPAGKYLFMLDNGVRAFSIDQSSGKLTEVAGSPFLAADNGIQGFGIDPSGHFLIVEHKNSVNVFAINAATGALTQVGPTYAVGDNLAGVTFATF